MANSKSRGNVLSQMNPLSQAEELLDNVKQQNSNVKSIFSNIFGLTKDVVTSPAPCEMSKFLTDQVCMLNERAINLMKGDFKLGFLDFKKVKDLAVSSKNIITKITNSPNKDYPEGTKAKNLSEDFNSVENKKELVKLKSNINKIQEINSNNEKRLKILQELRQSENRQEGGSDLSNYNYILNPITNQYVSVKTKLGKDILSKYVNSFVKKY